MSKKKSAALFVLITIILAVLCVWCTVSFEAGVNDVHSVISIINKDTSLGGGYTTVYYPEGVISAEDYEANLTAFGAGQESEKEDYIDSYVAYGTGAVYLEKDVVIDEDTNEVSEEFKAAFADAAKALTERFETRGLEGTRVEVCDGYTIRVTVPEFLESSSGLFNYFSYTGDFKIAYGTEDDVIIEGTKKADIREYVTGASSYSVNGASYVIVNFTPEGRSIIKTQTATASADSEATLYFMIGGETVVDLSVEGQIDMDSLYISGGFTEDTAAEIAIVIDNAVNGTRTDLALEAGEVQTHETPAGGANTMLFVYIGLGVLLLAMAVFFFVRYHGLGLVHLYSYLTYAVCMAMCLAFINFLQLGLGTLVAIVLSSVLLCVSNAVTFEYAKKEYELGKMMAASVKTGYQKCFWHLFDLHIILALAAFLVSAIALAELQTAAFVFAIGVLFSGALSLCVTRFYWAITMQFSKKQGAFCNFRRGEDVEDE